MSAQVNPYDDHFDVCNTAVASLAYKIFELLPTRKEIEQLGVYLVLNRGMTPDEAGAACASLEEAMQDARAVLTEAMSG
jgi:hypothetical protein